MDIARIDYWATSGESPIHRSLPHAKLLASAFVIATVVVTSDPAVLVGLIAMVLITARAAKLPSHKILLIALLPSFFALFFALSYVSTGWRMPLAVMAKAVAAASAMVLFISTTPYAEALSLLSRFLPRVLLDGMLMTYRSFFMLFDLFDSFVTALKLRAGFSPARLVTNGRNISAGIGMMFIKAYDKSQRLYDVMTIRGYSGRLAARKTYGGISLNDLPYPLAAAAYLGFAVAVRTGHASCGLWLPGGLIAYFALMEAYSRWKT